MQRVKEFNTLGVGPTNDTVGPVNVEEREAQRFRQMHSWATLSHAISSGSFTRSNMVDSVLGPSLSNVPFLSVNIKRTIRDRWLCHAGTNVPWFVRYTLILYEERCTDSLPWHVCTWYLNLRIPFCFSFINYSYAHRPTETLFYY